MLFLYIQRKRELKCVSWQRYDVAVCVNVCKQLKDIVHENLNVFVGACVDPPNICLVWHYCPKGSLQVTALDNNYYPFLFVVLVLIRYIVILNQSIN